MNIQGGAVTWILWGCEPFPETHGNLPPAYPDYSDGVGKVWPYGTFWNVPQLGTEPVRGTGCSTSGQIGDVIPDGLWAGYPTAYDWNTNTIGINLLCIFYGDSAQAVLAQGTANVVLNDPNYLIVNNQDRIRSMPSALSAIIVGQYDAAGNCVEGDHWSPKRSTSSRPATASRRGSASTRAWSPGCSTAAESHRARTCRRIGAP